MYSKGSITGEQKSNVIYRIRCPCSSQKFVGKTYGKLITRLDEHGTIVDQPIYQHLNNCSAFNDHIMLFTLPDARTATNISSKELNLHNAVVNNIRFLDKNNKCGQLQFIEGWNIKKLVPEINFGLKASK